jgi:hypothetical protein
MATLQMRTKHSWNVGGGEKVCSNKNVPHATLLTTKLTQTALGPNLDMWSEVPLQLSKVN